MLPRSTEGRISRSATICAGKACIAGHRVRVLDVVIWHEQLGMTADEIVSHVASITLADVHGALAYYFDHIDEIQQEMREARAAADGFRWRDSSLLEAKVCQERFEEAS